MLRRPDGRRPLKVRSVVGLLPICASAIVESDQRKHMPRLMQHVHERRAQMESRPQSRPRAGRSRVCGPHTSSLVSRRKTSNASFATCSMRTNSSALTASAPFPALPRQHPYIFRVATPTTPSPIRLANRRAQCLAETPIGGTLWFPSTPSSSAPSSCTTLLRQYFHHRMPHRLWPKMKLYEVAQELADASPASFCGNRGRRPVFGGGQIRA